MSGTPVQNNLIDLWSITDFALPGLFGSLHSFEKEFIMDTVGSKNRTSCFTPYVEAKS